MPRSRDFFSDSHLQEARAEHLGRLESHTSGNLTITFMIRRNHKSATLDSGARRKFHHLYPLLCLGYLLFRRQSLQARE